MARNFKNRFRDIVEQIYFAKYSTSYFVTKKSSRRLPALCLFLLSLSLSVAEQAVRRPANKATW